MKTKEGYEVKIFTDNIEENALEQIKGQLSIDVFANKKTRIMPDVHAGAGCVIDFTGDLGDKVMPNIVGVDIGCGMQQRPDNIFMGELPPPTEDELAEACRKAQEITDPDDEPEDLYGAWI